MWLLSTDRAELHHFTSPDHVLKEHPNGYAILSHVWDTAGEQSFQDIKALALAATSESPRDLAGLKIQGCCKLAERDGYKWVWIDTCCIDKSSSAELSEAINSMFRYYSLATVCYAYLSDVTSLKGQQLRLSRWHTRGWTLQELLAPKELFIVSRDWLKLGTKAKLADELAQITHIPSAILKFERSFLAATVAQRMSWAARRETTRVEDRAYSLFGLFQVHLPPLYGEGMQTFQRLQEEIMKQSTDTTLFAWGRGATDQDTLTSEIDAYRDESYHSSLFASSPSDFETAGNIELRRRANGVRRERVSSYMRAAFLYWAGLSGTVFSDPYDTIDGRHTFSITSHGVLAKMPIIETSHGYHIAVLPWRRNNASWEMRQPPLSPLVLGVLIPVCWGCIYLLWIFNAIPRWGEIILLLMLIAQHMYSVAPPQSTVAVSWRTATSYSSAVLSAWWADLLLWWAVASHWCIAMLAVQIVFTVSSVYIRRCAIIYLVESLVARTSFRAAGGCDDWFLSMHEAYGLILIPCPFQSTDPSLHPAYCIPPGNRGHPRLLKLFRYANVRWREAYLLHGQVFDADDMISLSMSSGSIVPRYIPPYHFTLY